MSTADGADHDRSSVVRSGSFVGVVEGSGRDGCRWAVRGAADVVLQQRRGQPGGLDRPQRGDEVASNVVRKCIRMMSPAWIMWSARWYRTIPALTVSRQWKPATQTRSPRPARRVSSFRSP